MCDLMPAYGADGIDGKNSVYVLPDNVGAMARAMTAAGYSVDIYIVTEGIIRPEVILCCSKVWLICIQPGQASENYIHRGRSKLS